MTETSWPIEDIPDADVLYYRIHRTQLEQSGGRITRGQFKERGAPDSGRPPSMSTDWSRYSTPSDSRDRSRQPAENLIVALPVGDVRLIEELTVRHAPLPDNRSHTDVLGVTRDPEARDRLAQLATIVLPLDDA